jgi:hypothetical protein
MEHGMFKKPAIMALAALALVFGAAACGQNKQDEALQKARDWELSNFSEGKTAPPRPAPLPSELKIDVPDSVKAKYTVVTMGVGNRQTKEIKKFKVKIGETAKVPGTDYTVKVIAYLPQWLLRGDTATTKSDEPKDPAVRAIIYEKGKPVLDGFIFEKHKTPSFITDKYVIGLLGAGRG